MVKSDVEIDELKGELRDWLYEKGLEDEDWYEVMWGVLVDVYVKNEVIVEAWKVLYEASDGCECKSERRCWRRRMGRRRWSL